MKIFSLTSVNFNNINPSANMTRQQIYNRENHPLYTKATPTKDTVCFTAKIPSIVTPTMEDLVKRTKAVDVLRFNVLRLAKHDVPCPVCGHLMLDVDKFNEFEANVLSTTSPKEILDYIGQLKKYLHPNVEAKIYSMMREDLSYNPNMTLLDILKKRLPYSEKKIVYEQSKIFTKIEQLSRKLPGNKRTQVQDLINETYSRILDPGERSRFSRYIFLNKLKDIFVPENDRRQLRDILVDWIYTPLENEIIHEATKLPMAYNNIDAFIVKYSKRNYAGANADQKIALRMLSNSLATVEHIKPQHMHGRTEPANLALECACDNNRRRDDSLIEQISENPQMLFNYRRYIKRLCELHFKNIVEKSYITQQNKTYYRESYGLLKADTSCLSQRPLKQKRREKSGITPPLQERRAARHEKLKAKKKSCSIKRSNKKY